MKRLIFGLLLLLLLCGCREEGIIIETMTPSPPTGATEPAVTTTMPTQTDITTETTIATETTTATEETTIPVGSGTYILNTGTKKFHLPTCSSAAEIKAENRKESNATRYELMAEGYAPCGRCDP